MTDLTGYLLVGLSLVSSLGDLGVPAIPALIHLLHLVLVLLQSCLVVVDDNLLFRTSVTVSDLGVLTVGGLQMSLATSGPETLLLNLSTVHRDLVACILTVSFLLLRLHLEILNMLLVGVLLVVGLGTLRGGVPHALDFSVVVLLLDLFEPLIGDFANKRRVVRWVGQRATQRRIRVLVAHHLGWHFS